ncbi:uncharacterized protein LOC126761659 [Bactrocera neohumeralis]|uniref:uncharacterized protein LOC126761659 n=1 Tax=Bactrocera neohumeralis TaxID=98809 RepID=UPI0021661C71|nr:uncharacterized protein LOC126761659 [Bactrocera neohumeralis]
MVNAIENVFYTLRNILIRITLGPISFVFLELSKFVLVLALAFWITVGIFMMWESIMPEAASRLSAAAAAVVANSSGLMPSDEDKDNAKESGSYPFVVDLPKTESLSLEKHIIEEALLQKVTSEGKSPSIVASGLPAVKGVTLEAKDEIENEISKSEVPAVKSITEEAKDNIKIEISKAEVASAEAVVSKQPSTAMGSEAGDSGKLIE